MHAGPTTSQTSALAHHPCAPLRCLCCAQCKSWSLRERDDQGEYICRLWSTDDVENNGGQITLEPGNRVPDKSPNWPEKYKYTSGNSEHTPCILGLYSGWVGCRNSLELLP